MRWPAAIGGEKRPCSSISCRAEGLSRLSRYRVGRTTAKARPAWRKAASTPALPTKLGSAQGIGRLALASLSTIERRPAATEAAAAWRAWATIVSAGPVGNCSTAWPTPRLAARRASASSRSASTHSMPRAGHRGARDRSRTSARTAKPRASAARTTAWPCTPAARYTRTTGRLGLKDMERLLQKGLMEPGHRRWHRSGPQSARRRGTVGGSRLHGTARAFPGKEKGLGLPRPSLPFRLRQSSIGSRCPMHAGDKVPQCTSPASRFTPSANTNMLKAKASRLCTRVRRRRLRQATWTSETCEVMPTTRA